MEGFCRGCLIRYNEPSELLPHSEKTSRLFTYSTGILVTEHLDTFQLCKSCFTNLKLSCKFKKQCRTSDKKYRHYLTLKEAGDAFEFATFITNNDDNFRAPLCGQSTPHNKNGEDDNESTCTSIHNFMSDILRDEEVPDTEASIIKEVIQEQNGILEDTLDSHWLQDDDVSVDTDFRDLSLSPFSTPRSIEPNLCYTPHKQFEPELHIYNNQSNKNLKLPTDHTTNDEVPTDNTPAERNLLQNQLPNQNSEINLNESNESQDYFDNINEKVNCVTQNKNDMAVQSILDSNNDNINYITQNENDLAVQSILEYNKNNINYISQKENDLAVQSILEYNDDDNVQNENMYAVKVLKREVVIVEQSNLDLNQGTLNGEDKNEVETIENANNHDENNFGNDHVTPTLVQNNHNISFSLQRGKEFHIQIGASNMDEKENNLEYKEESDLKFHIPVNHDIVQNNETKDVKGIDVIDGISKRKCIEIDDQNQDLENVQKAKENKVFILDEFFLSPKEFTGEVASTPTIKNILFGSNSDIDENSNRDNVADKISIKSGETDILDKMFKKGYTGERASTPTIKNILFGSNSDIDENSNRDNVADKISIKSGGTDILDKMFKKGYTCRGASTPTINNILFGAKSDIDENSNRDNVADKISIKSGETDILDNMLKIGVKELDVQSPSSKEVIYDLKKGYCHTCEKTFKDSRCLKLHLNKMHKIVLPYVKNRDFDTRTRICEQCGAVFKHFSSYNEHMKIHKQKETEGRTCLKCNMTFSSKVKLKAHMKTHDPIQDVSKNLEKKYCCDICGRHCANYGSLAVHVQRHSKTFSFECQVCNKGFYRKTDLTDHLRVHSGEKPFGCTMCGNRFRLKAALVKHMTVHIENDKNFECAHCGKRYTIRSDLVFHLKYAKKCKKLLSRIPVEPKPKKKDKEYKCNYCGQSFTAINLKRHQNSVNCEELRRRKRLKSPRVIMPVLYVGDVHILRNEENSIDVDVMEV